MTFALVADTRGQLKEQVNNYQSPVWLVWDLNLSGCLECWTTSHWYRYTQCSHVINIEILQILQPIIYNRRAALAVFLELEERHCSLTACRVRSYNMAAITCPN